MFIANAAACSYVHNEYDMHNGLGHHILLIKTLAGTSKDREGHVIDISLEPCVIGVTVS